MRGMSWIGLALLGAFCACGIARGQAEPPYEATIKNSSTVVHSAPSKRAYATDVLDQGTTVEVYRHDPGGWCAIRPPSTSFSLVPRAGVEITDDQPIGRVTQDGVKAWIGTRIRHHGDAIWQVKLSQGELVEILEVSAPQGTGDSDPWVLIAPPAGEFRWVHESNLRREATPPTVTFPDAPNIDRASQSSPGHNAVASKSDSPPRELPPDIQAPNPSDVIPDEQVMATAATGGDGFISRDGTGPQATAPTASSHLESLVDLELAPAQRLRLAEQTLSQLLLQEPGVTAHGLQQLLDSLKTTDTPAELRGQVQSLQDRFDRYLDLELKRTALARLAKSTPNLLADTSQSRPLGPTTDPVGTGPVDVASASEQFAVQGRLNRLIRSGGLEASSYAIQGDNGNIQAMVVAAPGVNLERYLKSEVGIQGAKSTHPRLKIPVVVAERVINLERHR